MNFNIEDPQTFLSKTDKKEFFGMQLTTFRVFHDVNNERHHNAVLVDSEGSFRGHVDAYSELIEQSTDEKMDYWLPANLDRLEEHKYCNILLMMDKEEGWVLDIICPNNLRPIQIVKVIDRKMEEAREIYTVLPKTLVISIADITIEVFIHKNQYILASLKGINYPIEIEQFFKGTLEYEFSHRKGLPNRRAFNTCMKLLENRNINADSLVRLVTEEFLQTPITLPIELDQTFILKELKKHYNLHENVFKKILNGEASILNLLEEQKYHDKYSELISIIDFGHQITEVISKTPLSTEGEVQSTVKDILLRYKVIVELEKGTKPKKIASDIFKKEMKKKNPETVKRLIAEMIMQTLNESSTINEQIEELIGYLQDRALKDTKDTSQALF